MVIENLDGWKIILNADEDGHLTVSVEHLECDELVAVDEDLGDWPSEFVVRLSSLKIERDYKESEYFE